MSGNFHSCNSVVRGMMQFSESKECTSILPQPAKYKSISGNGNGNGKLCGCMQDRPSYSKGSFDSYLEDQFHRSLAGVQCTHMRGEEVGDEIKAEAPPNSAENVACDLSHSLHQGKAVVNLGNELEQEHQLKYCHCNTYSFFF